MGSRRGCGQINRPGGQACGVVDQARVVGVSARSPAGTAGRVTDPGWRAQSSRSCAPANLRTNSGTKDRIRAWMKRSATRCTSQSTTAEPRRGSYCSCRDPATTLRSPASWACGRSEADARGGRSGPERSLGVISSASHTLPVPGTGTAQRLGPRWVPGIGRYGEGPASPLAGPPPFPGRPDRRMTAPTMAACQTR